MLWVLVIGLLVGIVAKFIMPGSWPGGIIMTILLGIGGAMLASWVGGASGIYYAGDLGSFVAAVLGAMALLFLYQILSRRKNTLS